ncbi:restriction endonuclease subunit S, partial [[Ruminococcus] torques]|uniref:restriction endonuclease subunit S n=3 Tax=[Ruminococcus] torques TaxID=33039 RepID=UPI00241CA7A3
GTMKCIKDEIPFEVPEGWSWCRLPSITIDIFAGGDKPDSYEKNPTEICNIPIYSNGIDNNGLYGFTNKPRVIEPSITISARGTIGFCCIRETPFVPIVRLITITPSREFELSYLKTVFEALIETGEGSSIPQLTVPGIKPKLIPVPPVNEQTRIQNKLHEILNSIAVISREKEELRKLLQTIQSKILDLAIRGKLVPQNPDDEPASVLLERIRVEKEELIKQGKIKRDKKESVIFKGEDNSYYEKLPDGKVNCIDEQLPFELPDGWKWCNLSMVGTTNIGLTYRPADIDTQGIIVLRSCNIVKDEINLTDLVRVKTSIRENQFVQKDDILICARNGSRSLVGKCTLIPEFDEKVSFGAFMAVYRTPYFNYIVHFLRSNFFRSVFDDSNSTAINQLTQDMLKRAVIPLPPLAEQLRIVDKITELFERLNCIEESLI